MRSVLTSARPMLFVASANHGAARQFYGETLGLRLLSDDEYAFVFAIHGTLLLRVQKVRDLQPQQFTMLGWQVYDIDDAVANLCARGVTFSKNGFPSQDERGIMTFPNGDKVAWFKDPDGNTLSIATVTV